MLLSLGNMTNVIKKEPISRFLKMISLIHHFVSFYLAIQVSWHLLGLSEFLDFSNHLLDFLYLEVDFFLQRCFESIDLVSNQLLKVLFYQTASLALEVLLRLEYRILK